jgi:hypothetical protein
MIIADFNNNRILVYNTIPASSGAAADVVVGQTNFIAKTTGSTASTLNGPESAFISVGGKLLIADRNNNRVLIYNTIPTSSGASADLVLGQTNFTNSGSGTTSTTLKTPTDVWTDGTKVIVADSGNARILIWNTFPISNGQAANVVVGQTNFTTGTGGLAANKFQRPWNFIASTLYDKLIVTDPDNNRVLIFNTIPTANNASATRVLGQANFTTNTAGCSQNAIHTRQHVNLCLRLEQ